MEREETRDLRKTGTQLSQLLNRLDQTSSVAASKRVSERYTYRSRSVVTEVLEPTGAWSRYRTPTRNLSATGIGLLVGRFIYPNTRCRVHLVTIHHQPQVVSGMVAHCRYLSETATIHEVGVRFDEPIDIEFFHHEAVRSRLLLVGPDESARQFVRQLLRSSNLDIVEAATADEAREIAISSVVDLILIDLGLGDQDGLDFVQALRGEGYVRPIIAIAQHADAESATRRFEAGYNAVLPRPLSREALQDMLLVFRDEPIISSLMDDPDLAALIDGFVAGLRQRVLHFERAFTARDLPSLESAARRLNGEAASYGFQVITDAAADLERAVRDKAPLPVLRHSLNALERLCLAARPIASPRATAATTP